MPLSASTAGLAQGIYEAYQNVKKTGSEDGADPGAIITQLAEDLSDAIHDYMTSALVTTTVTVDSSQLDSAGGSTTMEGSGAGTGSLS